MEGKTRSRIDLFPQWHLPRLLALTSRFGRSQMGPKIEAAKTVRIRSMSAQFLRSLFRRSLKSSNLTQIMAKVAIKVLVQIKLEEIKALVLPNYNFRANLKWPNNNNSSSRFSSNPLYHKLVAMANILRVMDQVKS